jgi:hypothetical protein
LALASRIHLRSQERKGLDDRFSCPLVFRCVLVG